MLQNDDDSGRARVIEANKMLQAKAGRGKIREEQVEACKVALERGTADFQPVAMEFLNRLDIALQEAASGDQKDLDAHRDKIFKPVFDLKANAKMFKYDLVTIMTNIMVNFLERVDVLDKDAVEIVNAHHKTLTLIVLKKMNGTGGEAGKALAKELQGACTRYFAKKKVAV